MDVVGLDAAYADKGYGEICADPVKVLQTYGSAHVLLGLCRINGANANVVRPTLNSCPCLFRSMGGDAYAHLRANKGPHIGQGNVLLPHMDSVSSAQHGDIHVIVHYEAGVVLACNATQQAALFKLFPVLFLLFPVLQDAYPRTKKTAGNFFEAAAAAEPFIGEGIEIGFTRQNDWHTVPLLADSHML